MREGQAKGEVRGGQRLARVRDVAVERDGRTLLEATLDDEASRTVDRAVGAELGKEELDDMLGLAVHALADVGDVGKDGALVALAEELRRRDRVLLLVGAARQRRVRLVQEAEEAAEELRACERGRGGGQCGLSLRAFEERERGS